MDSGFAQTSALFPVRFSLSHISRQEVAWAADVKKEIGDRRGGDPFTVCLASSSPLKKETRQTRTMLVVNMFNLSDKYEETSL